MATTVGDWAVVEDADVGTYVRHLVTGEVRWTLPLEMLRTHGLLAPAIVAPATATNQDDDNADAPRTGEEDADAMALPKEDEDIVSRWSLRASSLVYDDESLRSSIVSATLDDDNRGLNQFSAVADGGIFERPHCVHVIRSLQAWLRVHHPALDARTQAGTLRFPMFPCRYSGSRHVMRVLVTRPGATSSVLYEGDEANTVREVLTYARSRLYVDAKAVDGAFVLKVTGRNEYLLDETRPLGAFAHLHASARNKATAKLTLLELSAADAELKRDTLQSLDRSLPCISFGKQVPRAVSRLDTATVAWPFRIKMVELAHLPEDGRMSHLVVAVGLWAGPLTRLDAAESYISSPSINNYEVLETPPIPFTADRLHWSTNGGWLTSSVVSYKSLPASARLSLTVYGILKEKEGIDGTARRVALAAAWRPLFESSDHCLHGGRHTLSLWPCSMTPQGFENGELPLGFPTTPNPSCRHGVLTYELDAFEKPLQLVEARSDPGKLHASARSQSSASIDATLAALEHVDVLHTLTQREKTVLWQARHQCATTPALLPVFLRAINWSNRDAIDEARRLVARWNLDDDVASLLQVLGHDVPDPMLRAWVVDQLHKLPDDVLQDYVLQLVQVLKYEGHVDGALSRFLLFRSLLNPVRIGQRVFWLLKTEADNWLHAESYSILLATYVSLHPSHRALLFEQCRIVDQLELIAQRVKRTNKDDRLACLAQELELLNATLDKPFHLCLSLRFECRRFCIEKCQVMGSAKKPLWLTFENADPLGDPIMAIFKHGDDLRQDLMTLQLLRLWDKLWYDHGVDLRLKPYLCQSIGYQLGMIEVVPHAKTTAHIHRDYGHVYFGAWMATPIESYLKHAAADGDALADAVDHFIRTCAGYCVATYVLGIGDRHSDNIMVASSGHLFHIDFGHFLGNFKVKFGFQRERAPFVLTPEMAFAMRASSSEGRFELFERYCGDAYNLLRQTPALWVALFALMVPAHVPEMTSFSDILYLRDQLSVQLSSDEAADKFKAEIKNALTSTSRRVDNWMHNMKHGIDLFAS
ncbi:hypothetical protein SDRG_11209 [Saprolegnia diclina VS20]|uniref:Phosphatidylinositol 3-kinase n=1 Tax=Saprolegnia diclina (strain VS20) TaxID=1156394 RepID=T0RM50_SAPDV|nr:hypothetical protein SDRG_11209 [Saprolegnia diclina VS20]EQC31022.1 hypothetical protein SDRG_11209 [Saprolegnia diclina VS20]|eukprot:XP_008615461.1 hypothetical protein SDRG_11209 [Saprolegnia diclina VS20]